MGLVDRLFKYTTFVPTMVLFLLKDVTRMFFKHVVKLWGLLLNIILDWDIRFTEQFWTKLFNIVDTKLPMILSRHP